MKRLLRILGFSGLFLSLLVINAIAQAPAAFQYQAVVRDADGEPLNEQTVSIRLSLLPGSSTASAVYSENHSVSTNKFGMVTINVGKGTPVTGNFTDIDWAVTSVYLKVEINFDGSGFVDMGSSQLLSVPYALYAASGTEGPQGPQGEPGPEGPPGDPYEGAISGSGTPGNFAYWTDVSSLGEVPYFIYGDDESFQISSRVDAADDDPIFEVKNRDGQVVFGVYQTGVRIYVDETEEIKGTRSGFAVGGFSSGKAVDTEYLRVDPGSVRVTVSNSFNEGKGTRGGFAVGGFTTGKEEIARDFMLISPDSSRIWVNSEAAKGSRGGFAVGGYTTGKSTPSNFMLLTPENYLVGHEAGIQTTTGLYNSFFGYRSGYSNTGGSYNVFMGRNTGFSNTSGYSNILIGDESGYGNTSGYANVMIGNNSGRSNTTGFWNVFLGRNSGYSNQSGSANFFAGDFAGFSNTTGYNNIFLGDYAGGSNEDGSENVFIGKESGWSNTVGLNNVFIGTNAGYSNIDGNWNVFMGYKSGHDSQTGVSNVVIGNSAGQQMDTANYNVIIGTLSGYANYGGRLNVFVGQETGYNNTLGDYNTIMGSLAGYSNTEGNSNVFVGSFTGNLNTLGEFNSFLGTLAGYSNTEGNQNTFIGQEAGRNNVDGSWNSFLGVASGYNTSSGSGNVAIGNRAGFTNVSGNNNVFIGNWAGYDETGSNKLYIANSQSNPPLIYGDFSSGRVGLGTTAPEHNLHVVGSTMFDPGGYKVIIDYAGGEPTVRPTSGNWGYLGTATYYWYHTYTNAIYRTNEYSLSDISAKSDIEPLNSSLEKVLMLKGYSYSLNKSSLHDPGKSTNMIGKDSKNLGFIAQELMEVIPEMVVLDPETGLYMVRNYEQLFPVVVEAIKEQQNLIDNQGKSIDNISFQPSDRRWKTNVLPLSNSLDRITGLNGVSFEWRINEFPEKNFRQGSNLGFIAQDVEQVIPQIVMTGDDGYKSVDYAKLVPEIVEAIKEQQNIIDQQNVMIDKLEKENKDMKKKFMELQTNMNKILMERTSRIEPPPSAPSSMNEELNN